ncbi:sensor histidine kinase [Algoriphagus winogradskyi]|uniref:Histidine kinase n=1 Tax=Algoriphagus winogradskyi TaxID=237017 RepID=A0ABY1PDE0_9BACT|nr:histidine kinase [Algoriphagus winogradskyi]SMP30252.1 Histidine kinase [Algoriphagus winogradskyi]
MIKLINSKWFQHPVFWILSIYAIGNYFSISSVFKFIDVFYALLFHVPLFFLVYFNLRVLIPRFLDQGKYLLYFLSIPLLLLATYVIHELTFEVMFPLLDSEFYMVSFTEWQVLLSIFLIYLILTTLIKLSKSWYTLQQVEKEKLSLELNSLKTQINPHFLFNSLNSIYSQALAKSDQTSETVLELSNLLRYMLYEVEEDKVPLIKEVEMLENYIELQKLRLEEGSKVGFTIEGDLDRVVIAPLLLFPLVENAFKHGMKDDSKHAFIEIKLKVDTGISFSIRNKLGQIDDMEKGKYGGIGLENVKRRLELIYPKSHEFEILKTKSEFRVNLTLI